jgi:hypothetical protein
MINIFTPGVITLLPFGAVQIREASSGVRLGRIT